MNLNLRCGIELQIKNGQFMVKRVMNNVNLLQFDVEFLVENNFIVFFDR